MEFHRDSAMAAGNLILTAIFRQRFRKLFISKYSVKHSVDYNTVNIFQSYQNHFLSGIGSSYGRSPKGPTIKCSCLTRFLNCFIWATTHTAHAHIHVRTHAFPDVYCTALSMAGEIKIPFVGGTFHLACVKSALDASTFSNKTEKLGHLYIIVMSSSIAKWCKL